MDCVLDELLLGKNSFENCVSYEVHVQGEAIGSWIVFAGLAGNHAVLGPDWVTNTTAKYFGESVAISEEHSAFVVYIELGLGYLLAELHILPIDVLDGNGTGLVPTCPYNQVSCFDIGPLLLGRDSLNHLDSLLLSVHYS